MNTRTTKVVEEVMAASLAGDTERLLALMGPDVVVEWPYRPEGVPGELRGKRSFAAFLAGSGGIIEFHEYADVELHQTLDPEVVIVEYVARGTVKATGRPFEQRPVAVLRVRDGQVVSYRDYINPLPLMEALRP
ncbi:SnoaL-like domain-containing protein [Nonomuraea sp. FMUSA5-5]|uniref:SnoaL-like domain-containing protein n=1 Tax=Nonomuraea composti TaxID=2720023 RepID=A0ABX1B9H8_9ACTN|nr:nuclear transport factor 2 family protein [Nonomuraea sp. FMUSA5-5]NJP94449.1 SnoaL-like domain-containing protein [Nonomuraea sp. FMUSA5-5]